VAARHALDLAGTVPDATLVGVPAPSHFFWIGAGRQVARDAVENFLEVA
jgi:hypothetical protein